MDQQTPSFRPGTSPGTLQAAAPRVDEIQIELFEYGAEQLEERRLSSLAETLAYCDTPEVTWINIVGLHDVELLTELGERYHLHRLALEDVLNTDHRPKLEEYDHHLFLVLKLIRWRGDEFEIEQVSLFLGDTFVITFQEVPGDVFEPVRERLRKGGGQGRIRRAGADYLAYALVDALVDQFFPLLEELGERIETLEDELIDCPDRETLGKIHQLKRDLLILRRVAWPQREVVNAFERQEPPFVQPETRVYLRDCYDHAVQVLDMLETYRDMASNMLDVYLSSVSNRMNEVMKVLTVIASIFIPLTFLAGIYGMNFQYMPELRTRWGYPVFWGVILVVAGGMVWFFKRKRWL